MTNEQRLVLGNTLLRHIHNARGGTPLAGVLADDESWSSIREQLIALGPPEPPTAAPFDILIDRLALSIANGKRLSPTAAGKIHAEANGAVVLSEAAERLRERLTTALDEAVIANSDGLFEGLDARLQSMLTEARELADKLDGRDVEVAADAGLLAEFKRMRTLRGDYVQLRADQNRLWRVVEGDDIQLRQHVSAFLGNPMAADPELIPRRLGWKLPGRRGDAERPADPPPWPELWIEAGLDWCVAHPEARPHVPTPRRFETAEARIAKAAQAASVERDGPHKASLTIARKVR
jgi:hypothetical protein